MKNLNTIKYCPQVQLEYDFNGAVRIYGYNNTYGTLL